MKQPSSRTVSNQLFSLLIGFILIGCEVTIPDIPLEPDINKPKVIETSFEGIHAGDVVTGTINISAPVDSFDFAINSVDLYVDSIFVSSTNISPYTFHLNTAAYLDGLHAIILYLHEKNSTLGILNLTTAPRVICGTVINFDNAPPQKIENLRIEWDGGVVVKWKPVVDGIFKSYNLILVARSRFNGEYDFTTTITDPTDSSWRVNSTDILSGAELTAQISVTNKVDTGPFAQAKGTAGIPLAIPAGIGSFWQDTVKRCTYAWGFNNKMYVLSSNGSVTDSSADLRYLGNILFRKDRNAFYLFDLGDHQVMTYSTDNFSLLTSSIVSFTLDRYYTAVAGPGSDIYVADNTGTMYTVDANTGGIDTVITLPEELSITSPTMTATDDGKYIFTISKSRVIYKINAKAGSFTVEQQKQYSDIILRILGVSTDQKYIIAAQFTVTEWTGICLINTSDLTIVSTLTFFNPHCKHSPNDVFTMEPEFAQEGNNLFIMSGNGYINQFDLSSQSFIKSWCIINNTVSIGLSLDGKYIFLGDVGASIPNFKLER